MRDTAMEDQGMDKPVAPEVVAEDTQPLSHARWGLFALNRSPMTRKIVTFNLVALNVMLAGVLLLMTTKNVAYDVRATGMRAQLISLAAVLQVAETNAPEMVLSALPQGMTLLRLDADGKALLNTEGDQVLGPESSDQATPVADVLNSLWLYIYGAFRPLGDVTTDEQSQFMELVSLQPVSTLAPVSERIRNAQGDSVIVSVMALSDGGRLGLVNVAHDIDTAVDLERERVLQFAAIATLVSIFLSLVLAATISNPISDLADAAEIRPGRGRASRSTGRISIPDLTDRPDEIGRLSGSLRGMVNALYDQIDGNEQFAADVSHEIKNPLASLRSAVGSLRRVKKDEQRDKLLNVIDHDVRRLDRLVTDISNASRLDSELVKEDEVEFNLLDLMSNLSEFMGEDARRKGIEFISDIPEYPIEIHGLEARLAQVFVNLISNAISFCEDGDAIRVWVRRRDNRVLIVVEDTGPGIPENALDRIFRRFYTSRPDGDFGNNSGLGLAISKQIIEAHGGVVWAENIRPTEADPTSAPLGARFVVGLPV
jgi:two-component system sensor histidine kinase ChvG